MDDELQNLEAELKTLRPAPPSVALVGQIEHELSAVVKRRAPLAWFWGAALPAAAALALMAASIMRRDLSRRSVAPLTGTAAAQEVLKPVAAENVLYSVRDEGVVTLDDGTPARRERLSYVDTITWKNPHTHASLTWTVPREEVRVLPVSFQ